jgi:hypothetical protein
MLMTGLSVAKQEAQADTRREFLADWAGRDLLKGYEMDKLRPGEAMIWQSSYPHQLEERYGAEFLRSCGLVPDRKMGFLYRAECQADGSVVLESQTVDRSDPDAFAAVSAMLEYDVDADMEAMVRTYDGALFKKFGDYFYAGRREAEMDENAWAAIKQHEDLISYFMHGLENIARQDLPT